MIVLKWFVVVVLISQFINRFIEMIKEEPSENGWYGRLGRVIGYVTNFSIKAFVIYIMIKWLP